MKFVIVLTTSADTSETFEVSAERLAELLGGVKFDPTSEDHRDAIAHEFWRQDGEVSASICAQCSGWGHDWELSIGDDWEVSDVFEERGL